MKIELGFILLIIQFPFICEQGCASDIIYSEIGAASWYGSKHHGRQTASGERFDMNDYTAAHRSLPIGTRVRVFNPRNGKEVIVRINDRGPFNKRRIIDVSRAAARVIGLIKLGVAKVKVEVISMPKASYSFNSR
jgi:rare lipoprotein A